MLVTPCLAAEKLTSIGEQINGDDPATTTKLLQAIDNRDQRCANDRDFEIDKEEAET